MASCSVLHRAAKEPVGSGRIYRLQETDKCLDRLATALVNTVEVKQGPHTRAGVGSDLWELHCRVLLGSLLGI